MRRLFVFLILLVFIAGCAEQGVKVVKVGQGETPQTTAPAVPVQNAQQNQTPAANNTPAAPVNQGASTKADLGVTGYYLSILNAEPNEDFEVKFKITNSGTAAISNFEYSVKIMKGNDVIKSDVYNYSQELAAGASSERIVLTYYMSDTGSYDVIVKLDPFNAYAEPNENNNEGKQKLNVIIPISGNSSTVNTITRTNRTSNSSGTSDGCTDTDGGKVYGIRGTCTDSYGTKISDVCTEVNQIWEWYCSEGRCANDIHTCTCNEDLGICT